MTKSVHDSREEDEHRSRFSTTSSVNPSVARAMIPGNAVPAAIEWHEGMLLSPQHFQQASLRGDALLTYHMQAAQPYFWGIRHCVFDTVSLAGGVFRVQELEGVAPDGLLMRVEAGEVHALEIDLNDHLAELQGRQAVIHLAVPARPQGGAKGGEARRYDSVEGPITRDETTGEGDLRIPRLKPRLLLYIGDELPARYIGFPLAKVTLQEEAFMLTRFVAPHLCLGPESGRHGHGRPVKGRPGERSNTGSDNTLYGLCAAITQRVREKALALGERAGASTVQSDPAMLLQHQLSMLALSSSLPNLEALLNSGVQHPYTVYLSLVQLAGAVAVLGGTQAPPLFAAYDHNDPMTGFEAVTSFISQMLDRISDRYKAIPFQESNGAFTLDLHEDWLDHALVIGVRARQEQTDADVVAWMEGALIGSEPIISTMTDRRLLGAGRRLVERDDGLGLTPSRGVALFQIEVDPEFILSNEDLRISTLDRSGAVDPLEIVLYVPAENAAPSRFG